MSCKARTASGGYVIACQLPEGHKGVCINLRGEAISIRELTVEERETSAAAQLSQCHTAPAQPA